MDNLHDEPRTRFPTFKYGTIAGTAHSQQHAADNILPQLTEAETTLIGWPRGGTPPPTSSKNEGYLLSTAEAQDDYVEALKRDTDGSAEQKAGDEKKAWRSYGKMVRVLESPPAHIRKKAISGRPLQSVRSIVCLFVLK